MSEQNESFEEKEQDANVEQTANESSTELVDQLRADLEEAKNKYLYLYSDFEGFKRNAAKERIDLISTAGRDIMSALLPIMDDFDRAAKNGGLSEGVELIRAKMEHTLQSKGLRRMDLEIGSAFNADEHEAVAEIPAADENGKGKVVDILEQGYLLGNKIIRFAKVVVGR